MITYDIYAHSVIVIFSPKVLKLKVLCQGLQLLLSLSLSSMYISFISVPCIMYFLVLLVYFILQL